MKRLAVLLLLCGCGSHAAESAANADIAAQYALALNDCLTQAQALRGDGGSPADAEAVYTACADKADAFFGRTGK